MIARWFDNVRSLGGKSSAYLHRKRRRRMVAKLEESGLFDRAWYLETYPDVRDGAVDPVHHYLETGWKEGRDPGPDFCTTAYLKANSDVAATGINPLLHFVEHGRVEGRGTPHQTGPLRAVLDPVTKFGPAAPCARFPVSDFHVPRWRRAGRIGESASALELGGVTVCKVGDQSQRNTFEQALRRLAWLSGDLTSSAAIGPAHVGKTLELRDAWCAGHGVMRMRWKSDHVNAVVIRAIQHVGREPELVGEACVGADLDVLDVKPANLLFPLLFLFTTPEGDFLGVRHLTFPGLCRGNSHYSELVALTRKRGNGESVDVASTDEELGAGLIRLREGKVPPLVADVIVDIHGADGSCGLFQAHMQEWLGRVMRVAVRPSMSDTSDAAQAYLADAVAVETAGSRSAGLATLRLAANMIPTISILAASGSLGNIGHEQAGSLIVESDDAAGKFTLVHVPPGAPASDFGGIATALATLAPREGAKGLSAQTHLLGIRVRRRRRLSDAELLFPGWQPDKVAALEEISISWFVWPHGWNESNLLQSLQALAEQSSCLSWIVFVGEPPVDLRSLAEKLFAGRVRIVADSKAAAAALETGICGYLGSGIILHDHQTVERLVPLLEEADALSATALVVVAEKRGKGALVVHADGDEPDALSLAGAVVPIDRPPLEFWISRSDVAARWLESGAGSGPQGRHLCSTLVSVSALPPSAAVTPPVELPCSLKSQSIATELLVG
jgi:hypothetical protein